jgi:hypothetical protein
MTRFLNKRLMRRASILAKIRKENRMVQRNWVVLRPVFKSFLRRSVSAKASVRFWVGQELKSLKPTSVNTTEVGESEDAK